MKVLITYFLKAFFIGICVILINIILISCDFKVTHKPSSFKEDRKAVVTSFVDGIKNTYHIPGIAFTIVHQDSIFSNAVGIKNDNGESIVPTTAISTGSLSEPLLAYAILKLSESGKIDLDDKVVKYLPYFKMRGESYKLISIRNLLTHSSGIDHYSLFYDNPSFSFDALETTTRSIENQTPKWEIPKLQVLRSAYNYDILADLISKVAGIPFEEYVRKSIFMPIQMENASFSRPSGSAEPFQTVDFLDYSFKKQKLYPYNRENGGSRGGHASAVDMGKWMFHVLNEKNSVFFNKELKTGYQTAVGFGWDIYTDESGVDIFSKDSEFGGFTSQMIMIPSLKIGVVVLSNIYNAFNSSKITSLIVSWLVNGTALSIKTPVHLKMGLLIKKTGNTKEAIDLYQKIKKEKSSKYDLSLTSLLQLGMNLAHRENKPNAAIEIMKFSTNEYPNSCKAALELAECYLIKRDLPMCKSQIKHAGLLKEDTIGRSAMIEYLNEKMEIIEEKKVVIN
ncbi:serine hydrolase [Chryseobacterium sp. Mn2064]|uniref:serine hydrolase n=1 Tax=Chryseobacterium sp. Mn2064 TaxID=3395263 RepID=UPI003BCAF914